jgi:hypothetical protein
MTITLERLGNNRYGFGALVPTLQGLGDCPCDQFGDVCSDGTACTPATDILDLPFVSSTTNIVTPGITPGVAACAANQQIVAGQCVTPSSIDIAAASTANAADLSGSYYTTGGNLVMPGTGSNGAPAGSYVTYNATTGAVIGSSSTAPPAVALSTSVVPGISNTVLIGAAVLAVFVIAISNR